MKPAELVRHLVLFVLFVLAGAEAAEPQPMISTLVDGNAISFGTFHSNNQKVVQNARGIFMTHIRTRNEKYTAQQWRLSWSRDGGKTFTTIHEATAATNPPTLETDAADNLYAGLPDFVDHHIHLLRFLSAEDYRAPHRTSVPKGAAGKHAMMLDERRGVLGYFSHNGSFHRFALDGAPLDSITLTQPGKTATVQYPHLFLAADGVLHAAWTSLHVPLHRYWAIHHAQSADGGATWTNFAGRPLAHPIIADENGPSDRITLDDEFDPSTWLANMLIKEGKAHFLYSTNSKPPRQHHMRFDVATGRREIDHGAPVLKGETLAIRALDGFFATDPRRPGSPLYCVSREVKSRHLVCLFSRDNGATWHDHAVSAEFNLPYGIGGCREVTPDGYVIGSFTELEGTETNKMRGGKVWFFKIKAEVFE